MPLNSHSYLVAQGWEGTGKALREGAIDRPVIIAQKKSLVGVGKDRDEAFPFWDHVFAVAATTIQVKLYHDDGDEESDTPQPSDSNTPLDRTSTGILSNKPQKVGLSAFETLATPQNTHLTIAALAKRESARRGLYSKFFRGPVLGPDDETIKPSVLGAVKLSLSPAESNGRECNTSTTSNRNGKKRKGPEEGKKEGRATQKKRKSNGEVRKKEERKGRGRLKRLQKVGEKRETSGMRVGSDQLENGSATSVHATNDDNTRHSRKEDHRKNKRKKVQYITDVD